MTDRREPGASAGARAARGLLDGRDAIAREVTDALFSERPELMEKYGRRGYDLCIEDMRHNVEHLAPAVELEEPGLFAGYTRWLDELLRSRGVPTGEVVRCLELTEAWARERLSVDEADAVARSVRAGLDAIRPGGDA